MYEAVLLLLLSMLSVVVFLSICHMDLFDESCSSVLTACCLSCVA